MTIDEALKALAAGKHIRSPLWTEGFTVFMDKNGHMDGNLYGELGNLPHGLTWAELFANDLEIAEPSGPLPKVGFEVALAAMRQGKNVKRRIWNEKGYVYRLAEDGQRLLAGNCETYVGSHPLWTPVRLEHESLLATDWEILP